MPYANETVRVVNVRPVNHFKHLMLTLITAGLWAPVWIIAVMNRNMTK